MLQKVITVTCYPEKENQNRNRFTKIEELDFPKITAALDEGYQVKEIKQVTLPEANASIWFILTFVLEKPDAPTAKRNPTASITA